PRPLTGQPARHLEALTAEIEDEGLKAALTRLGTAVLGQKR
ncbi:DUF721 domain-containing protein, partial [Rhizobiaceae bacterium CRRU44]|nr:DUF721 domain-containing protein [Ferranicluibacter rubi]